MSGRIGSGLVHNCEFSLKRDERHFKLARVPCLCEQFLPEDFCWRFIAKAFARCPQKIVATACLIEPSKENQQVIFPARSGRIPSGHFPLIL